MTDIFDYLKWRGDLTFEVVPLNEIDALIFSAFAYIEMDSIFSYHEFVSIKDLYDRYKTIEEDSIFKKKQNELFKVLSESKRFQDIVVTRYFNEVNENKEMQISGTTFILPNDILYVAFKGTDSTLTGWKEDFNLSYMKVIPSEEKALSYLNEILYSTKKKVYVGGHSKGGNLAMYASLFCENDENILQVHNFDGPGFSKEIVEMENYKKRKEKITTYIPKSSIVGNILNKDTKTYIVKSKQIGILEHDLYSWIVSSNRFIYAKEVSLEIKNLSESLNEAIEKIPKEDKEKIIDLVYEILKSWNIRDIESTLEDTILFNLLMNKYNLSISDFSIVWEVISFVLKIVKEL